MKLVEELFDEYLNINTTIDESEILEIRSKNYKYLPTLYTFLEKLFTAYPFNEQDHFMDIGCGKGRAMMMAALHSCKNVSGIEVNTKRFDTLNTNIKNYQSKFGYSTAFNTYNMPAEKVVIVNNINKFFFFNPFDIEIYILVMESILKSLMEMNRDVALFLNLPEKSTVEYFDSLKDFHRVESLEYKFISPSLKVTEGAQFIIYSNYSMARNKTSFYLW